jgi:hypothetical protein
MTSEIELLQMAKTDLLDHITHLAHTGLNVKKPIEKTASKGGTTCPNITITPSVGGVGNDILISGTGFQPQEQLQLFIGQEKMPSKIFRSEDGGYVTWVKTPNMSYGTYILSILSNTGNSAASVFKINQSINVRPSFGNKWTLPILSGSGFASESPITVYFHGTVLPFERTIITTKRGEFSTPISIPKETIPGDHTIDVRDGRGNGVLMIFKIIAPVISVSSIAGRDGIIAQITGTGFNSESLLKIFLSDCRINIPVLRTTVAGTFNSQITLHDGLAPGYHTISVSDEAGNTASATLPVVALAKGG